MPFNAPVIRATGDLMTAAIWNSDVVANLNYLYSQSVRDTEFNAGNSGAAITLNFATNGPLQRVTRTTNCTFTLVAPSLPQFVVLKLLHDGTTTTYTVAFSPTVKWDHGVAPPWSNGINQVDIVTLYWDGSGWTGSALTAVA
jgi:hypothetical protein